LYAPAAASVVALSAVAGAAFVGPLHAGAAALGGLVLVAAATLGARARLGRRPPAPADGALARDEGFRALAEEGGRTWFWETDADGILTYSSPGFAGSFAADGSPPAGHHLAGLLVTDGSGDAEGDEATLSFHLNARFPFRDVPTEIAGSEDRCLLSGTPRFDEIGRFLGFRGCATPLTAEKRAETQNKRLARFDSLTGLPNRTHITALLDEAIANSDVRKQSCALFLIDLDRFKQVNDTLGHPAGDVLLQQVAERLREVLGSDGQAGRVGGDEFEAVFPGIGEEGRLAAAAAQLIDSLSAPYLIHGHAVTIGASVGVAISRPGKTYRQALVKEADLALYAAKRAGRGTYRFFRPEMHEEETERTILARDLKQAAAKGQLKLLYQPIVAVSSETLVGFEALVRWWHPTRGPLSPADFLPIAESSGQMLALGEWIVRTACAEAAHWPRHLRLAVNLAPGQLAGGGIAAVVASALGSSGLDPDRLELEVDEDVLLSDDGSHRDRLLALHGLGVRLVLDDFGGGAASLASLKAVPLDRIKLHPSFLRSALPPRSPARKLAAAVVKLADSLGMRVTAEGAETLEDLELIRALGCDDVQGFLFGRPMEQAEARGLAAESKPVDAREAALNRPPRHSLIRAGFLAVNGANLPVRLRNLSGGGAMVECRRTVEAGTEVELDLGDGVRSAAIVRWSHDGRMGLQFVETFDLSRLGRARREGTDVKMLVPDYLRDEKPPLSRVGIRNVRSA
jgi:diguanylate cyclase (GGDEF)-like protein